MLEEMTLASDFTVFMRGDCPEWLRQAALRRLWRFPGRGPRKRLRAFLQPLRHLAAVQVRIDARHEGGDAAHHGRGKTGAEIGIGKLIGIRVGLRDGRARIGGRQYREQALRTRRRVDAIARRSAEGDFGAQAAIAHLGAHLSKTGDGDTPRGRDFWTSSDVTLDAPYVA